MTNFLRKKNFFDFNMNQSRLYSIINTEYWDTVVRQYILRSSSLDLILRFSVAYRYGEKKSFGPGVGRRPQRIFFNHPYSYSNTAKMVKRKLGALEKVEADLYVHFSSRCARRSEDPVEILTAFLCALQAQFATQDSQGSQVSQ
jgi:hypothetical protein